jgi:hypothetical protein
MKTFRGIKLLTAKAFISAVAIHFSIFCHADPLSVWSDYYLFGGATSIAYGNGMFVGINATNSSQGGIQRGTGNIFLSYNGSNWTPYATTPYVISGGIAFGNGAFVTFGMSALNNTNYILESTDGTTWSRVYTGLASIAWTACERMRHRDI